MKLLDHKEYDHAELIEKMYEDAFYYGVMGVDKCLSYSTVKQVIKSPKWFDHKRRKPDPESQALRDGNLVHTQILEPEKYDKFHFCDTSTKSTKKWKLDVEKYGKAYTFTMKEKYMNNRTSSAFLQNDACTKFMKGAEVEVPAIQLIEGIPFRGKADILKVGEYVADVKTTADGVGEVFLKDGTVSNQFAFTIKKYDYDIQAYLYTQLYDVPDFYWLVVDKITTDIGVFKASEETLQRGKDKLEIGIGLYKAFFIDELIDLSQYHKAATI